MGRNRICELLGIKYPIIQAPMNWVSGADLVAAVSNAGGLGTLGPNSGAKDITWDVELTAERMRDQIRMVRSLTQAPFAVNIVQYQRNSCSAGPMLSARDMRPVGTKVSPS